MNSAKIFSVVSLASATTVASFMALMIIRGTMPIMQMAPFIGLNGAIVGGLFYLGIDAITSFSSEANQQTQPKLVMVRDNTGRVLAIKSGETPTQEPYSLFEEEPLELDQPLSQKLGLTNQQLTSHIKTLLLLTLLIETYLAAAYLSNNFTPLMVVTTESMEPTLNVGDLIYVKGVAPTEIKVGDIVTFKPPANYMGGTLVTHRVVEVSYDANEVYFRTKGDNNPSIDPWLIKPSDIIGVQKAALPGVGRVFLWIRTPSGLAVAGLLLVVYLFWPNIKENLGGFHEP